MPSCFASPDVASRRLLGTELGVAGRFEHGVQRLLVLARVVVAPGDRGHREVAGAQEVHPADLRRIHADLIGGDVDDPFDELRGLRSASTAIRADRGVVGDHGLGVEPHLGNVVHADGHHLGEHRQDRTDGRVRAGGGHDRAVEADDLAVVVHTEPGGHHVVAAVHERDHVLGSCLDPLDGATEVQCGLGGDDVLDVSGRLGAEATTDPRAHDPELFGSRPSIGAYPAWIVCGAWCDTHKVNPSPFGTARTPLFSIGTPASRWLTIVSSATASAPSQRVAALLAELADEADVRSGVREQQRCVGGQSVERVDDDGQGIDVDDDLLGGVGRLRPRLGDHGGDDVADETDLVVGEHRAVERVRHIGKPWNDGRARSSPRAW